jgi:hypothetical protein
MKFPEASSLYVILFSLPTTLSEESEKAEKQ